jgi:hypothetical protein
MSEHMRDVLSFRETLFKPWAIAILAATLVLCIAGAGFGQTAPKIIKVTPGLKADALAGRPDTDIIEFSNGQRMSLGSLHRLRLAVQKMHGSTVNMMPAALHIKPDGNNIKVHIKAGPDIATALKLPDSNTVRFPSGRVATVAQIKFVQPYVEKKLGRKLTDIPQRPNLSGPTIKFKANMTKEEQKAQMMTVFDAKKTPDSTVIESPNGVRVSVGELKAEMKRRFGKHPKTTPGSAPKKTAPNTPPTQG